MLTKLKLILAGIGAFLLLLVGVFFKGRSSGEAKVEQKVQDQYNADVTTAAKTQVENIKVKADVQSETINSSDSTVDSELSDRWTRG